MDAGTAGAAKIAIIGEETKIIGFGLAGALLFPAEKPDDVRAAWDSLGDEVAVVLLTPKAATSLTDEHRSWPLTVVMPP